MNRLKKIGLIVGVLLIGVLLYIISTHKFTDSHLRKEGIRVRLREQVLMIDGCEESSTNITYCKKNIDLNGEVVALEFEFINFKENGYPNTLVAKLAGKEFYRLDNLQIETNPYEFYQIVRNFNTIGNYIVFTHTIGTTGNNTTLYALDKDGNIALKEFKIEDTFLIKDFKEYITYDNNVITLLTTKLDQSSYYKEDTKDPVYVCDLNEKEVVEKTYTYTYKDNKFVRKETKKTTVKDYLKENTITCPNS